MTEVVSVKFKSRGKAYYFEPGEIKCEAGQQLVVETSKGLELAECFAGNHYVNDDKIVPPLRPVVRIATEDDLRIAELCKAREKEAFAICEQKIAQHGLDMKLVDVECNFEGSKILFFFTSDGRVDFRELVKDLAGVFRTRIELRQIGVRDEAKMLGGLGICGRPFCCKQFLEDFQPVSTKMAKTQSLSLNPTKISGTCGRLMCCLRYEQEAYEDLVKTVPKNGAFVETPAGYGNVVQVNLLRQKVKVKLDGIDEAPKTYDADEVAAIPGGRPKAGEPLPHILELKPKKEEEEETPRFTWERPELFGEMPEEEAKPEEPAAAEEKKSSNRHRNRRRKPSQKSETQAREPQSKETAKAQPKPAEKKAEAAPEKKSESGEKSSGANNRRRHRSKKPNAAGAEQAKTQPKTPENKPKTQPKPAGKPEGSGEKKPNNNRRRFYGKPKNKQGGGKSE